MNATSRLLLLCLTACSAPVLAPVVELAGSQPVGTTGTAIEDSKMQPPFPAWTTATPITLVAPGGANLGVLDKVGVRVKVLQIRAGRIHVSCTACDGEAAGAEGYLPRGVLWMSPAAAQSTPDADDDPLSLLLAQRARWAEGLDLPAGTTAAAMCWLADSGIAIDGNKAEGEAGGGSLKFQRRGASWRLTNATPPSQSPDHWRCNAG